MKYGLHYRPAGIGSVPKGNYTVSDHPAFRYGVIEYAEPLTDEQVREYQLVPIVPVSKHAALLIKRMGLMQDKYLAKLDYIPQFVQTFRFDDGVFSTGDNVELSTEVERQLKQVAERKIILKTC